MLEINNRFQNNKTKQPDTTGCGNEGYNYR